MKRRPQNSPFSLVSPSSCSNTKVPASLFLPYLSPHYPMFPSSPPDEFPPQPQPAPNPPLHSNTTAVSGRRSSASPRHRPPEDVDNHQNPQQQGIRCPRCDSTNTKFCYYNNYSLAQPRHFCKTCRRYWTNGGAIRNIPIGGGCRKNKKPRFITPGSTPLGSSSGSGGELNLFQGIHFDALSSSSPALHVGYPQPGNHAGINFSVPPPRFSLYNSNNTNHQQQQQTNYLSSSLVNQHNGNHVISFNPPVLQSYLQSPPPSMSGGDHHHSVDLTGGGSTSGSRSSSLLGLNFNHHHHSFTTPSSTSTGGMMCGQYGEISGLISSGGGGNANTSPVGSGTSLITTCIESLSSINQELHLKLQQQRLALYYSGVGGGSIGKGNGNGNVKAEEKVGGGQGQGQQLDVGVGVSCNQQQHAEETTTRVQTEKPQGMFFQSLEMATSNNRYDEKTRGGDDHGTEWCFGSGSNGTETTTVAMSTVALATTTTTTSGFSTSNGGGNSVSWSSDNPFTFSNLIGLDKH